MRKLQTSPTFLGPEPLPIRQLGRPNVGIPKNRIYRPQSLREIGYFDDSGGYRVPTYIEDYVK